MNPEFACIKTQVEELGVGILTISRPSALNALNTQTLQEMREALSLWAKDPSIRAVILTGDGAKAFIAGADIAEMKDKDSGAGVLFSQLGHQVAHLLEQMPKPTIAAVNGFALGGGTEMAIACDFILASDNAAFGQPEVSLGIIAGFGATVRLARFVGLPRAKEWLFSGRRVLAAEALQWGLCNAIYPQDKLMSSALALAQTISKNSAPAVAKTKALVNEFAESSGLGFKVDAEAHAFGRLFGSPDQREGMAAFLEKRKPAFEGISK